MDVVQQLIQQVVRGFYDVRAVIVMDAMLTHRVLSDKDLTTLLGMSAKDLRAVCAKLKDDHLLREVSRKDDASREFRTYSQTQYYIHFTEAVDAIKWKMYSIENKLRTELDAQHNPQDYICDVCKTRYDTIAAAALFNPETGVFVCEVCGGSLREDDGPSPEEQSVQDRMGELMVQLQPLINVLKKIDDLTVPENTFQSELQQAVPVPEINANPNRAEEDNTLASGSAKLPDHAPTTFQVHITSEAERREDEERLKTEKRRLAEENALPEWHVQSTVGNASYDIAGAVKADPDSAIKSEGNVKGSAADNGDDAMDAYYKKLQAQQAENDDDEEDEEDEFEDVEV